MAKRRVWWCGGILTLVVLLGATVFGVMLKHEPNFYQQSRVEPSKPREILSQRLVKDFAQMRLDINARRETWKFNASETQFDSFLAEFFPHMEPSEKLRKLGMTDPIIALDEDCIRVAVRFGSGWFSTVISCDLQVWLVPKEPNAVAVKVVRARAGAVPISSQTVLHHLADLAHDQNIDINLYRHEGKSVAILKLNGGGDYLNPTWILTALKVGKSEQGPIMLAIRGCTPEHVQPPLAAPPEKTDATQ